ncbi:MAG: KH domain-containing protein [Chloroflexota bacterium]|nr:KH domain-containing protein [Chloroflexota bacterium]
MKELVEYIAKAIVDKPSQVRVTELPEEEGQVTIQLEVAPEDMGKVIGRQGRIAQAIRTLLRVAALRGNTRAVLKIVEGQPSEVT